MEQLGFVRNNCLIQKIKKEDAIDRVLITGADYELFILMASVAASQQDLQSALLGRAKVRCHGLCFHPLLL